MSLADRFSEAPVPQGPAPRRVREPVVKGWEPGVRVDGTSGAQEVTTPALQPLGADEELWRAAVRDMGIEVPAGWAVRLVEMRYDPAAWHRDSPDEKAVTRPAYRYKFRVEPAGPSSADIDDLLALVREAAEPAEQGPVDPLAFIVAIGDTQFGKVDGDGIEGTIKRVLASTEAAADRLAELIDAGKTPSTVYILWLGDCIEGFVSQGGGNAWRTPTTLTEQVRIVRRLMLHQIDTFRELAPRVVLASVPGNHDEAVRSNTGKVTRYDDSWAIEAAVSVGDAMEINPDAYGHCSVVVPGRDELTLTLDMAGTIVGLAHGHQMRAGKAHEWWAGQAHGLQPIGEATLLLTGHFHHLVVERPGAKTWIQIPAMESESTWWRHMKGQVAPAGIATMLVGGGGWSDLQIV